MKRVFLLNAVFDTAVLDLISHIRDESFVMIVVCFLLGDSPASEFYMPTFRNTVPSS
jgi:hypothetical protein